MLKPSRVLNDATMIKLCYRIGLYASVLVQSGIRGSQPGKGGDHKEEAAAVHSMVGTDTPTQHESSPKWLRSLQTWRVLLSLPMSFEIKRTLGLLTPAHILGSKFVLSDQRVRDKNGYGNHVFQAGIPHCCSSHTAIRVTKAPG